MSLCTSIPPGVYEACKPAPVPTRTKLLAWFDEIGVEPTAMQFDILASWYSPLEQPPAISFTFDYKHRGDVTLEWQGVKLTFYARGIDPPIKAKTKRRRKK